MGADGPSGLRCLGTKSCTLWASSGFVDLWCLTHISLQICAPNSKLILVDAIGCRCSSQWGSTGKRAGLRRDLIFFFFFFNEVRDAASISAYYGYPKLWILRYPAHRYHAVDLIAHAPREKTRCRVYHGVEWSWMVTYVDLIVLLISLYFPNGLTNVTWHPNVVSYHVCEVSLMSYQ
jgi:hypothetical protein